MNVVVVAVAAGEADALRDRVRGPGVGRVELVDAGGGRRLLRAEVDDDTAAERLAAALRADGWAAVARPAGGPRLEAWWRHTEPITFGDRLALCFAWSEHPRPAVEHVVEIGAGGWGGHHPTTQLLIEQLLQRVAGGERVLDVGCGSGVLGLCALALGASRVVGVDIKPAALDATIGNARRNGMADRVEVALDPRTATDPPFDVVLANVGRGPLVELGPTLAPLVAAGGWLAASGFPPSQLDDVAAALRPLREVERPIAAGWAAVVLSPVGTPPAPAG